MTPTKRWQPPHFRRGCWVESYRRSNGVAVKRHWRNGHHVAGHFSLSSGAERAQPSIRRARPPAMLVPPTPNHAAVAIALEAAGLGRATTRSRRATVQSTATLQGVSWKDAGEERTIDGITAAAGIINLPPEVDAITIQIRIAKPDGVSETVPLFTPCFANADGTITVVRGARIEPELVNRVLAQMDQRSDLRQRNRVRQRLGQERPEQSMQEALADTFDAAPLPDLPITQRVSIALPDAGYTVTVERYQPAGARSRQ